MIRLIQCIRAVALTMILFSTVSVAENMKKMGTFDVHYIALGASFVTPEVARAYNIKRSKYNGLINISVLDNTQVGKPAKKVSIMGTAQNQVGQIRKLAFREVKEGKAIYYLAEMSYADLETYNFTLDITDGTEDHQLTFSQTFYVD